MEKKGVSIVDGYGETPFSTFQQIAEAANITTNDHYVELGSGRGKTCVWAALFCHCQVTGSEWVPSLFSLSKNLCLLFRIPVKFELKSFFDTDLSQATVVYLYSTQLTEQELAKIPFSTLQPGSKLITVSHPHPSYPILKTIPVTYPWGQTQAFVQIISYPFSK